VERRECSAAARKKGNDERGTMNGELKTEALSSDSSFIVPRSDF
jgi:hypothetical protein